MGIRKNDIYYKVRKERHDYLGERYFRYNNDSETCVQVCIFSGDVKKGKSNTFGIYVIHKMTLFANYLAPGYVEPCTKREFDKHFNKCVEILK